MLWCCDLFSRLIDDDIEKGISVFASKKYGKDVFFLQAYPFEKKVIAEFSKIDPETGFTRFPEIKTPSGMIVPLNIKMKMAIHYCMFCGKKLNKVIKKNQKEFDRLAENHIRLMDEYYNESKLNGPDSPDNCK